MDVSQRNHLLVSFQNLLYYIDVTANLLISREVVAFSCQILEKAGVFRPQRWLLLWKWRICCGKRGDVLQRKRGDIAEK